MSDLVFGTLLRRAQNSIVVRTDHKLRLGASGLLAFVAFGIPAMASSIQQPACITSPVWLEFGLLIWFGAMGDATAGRGLTFQ